MGGLLTIAESACSMIKVPSIAIAIELTTENGLSVLIDDDGGDDDNNRERLVRFLRRKRVGKLCK